jgi:hypothetical protein
MAVILSALRVGHSLRLRKIPDTNFNKTVREMSGLTTRKIRLRFETETKRKSKALLLRQSDLYEKTQLN